MSDSDYLTTSRRLFSESDILAADTASSTLLGVLGSVVSDTPFEVADLEGLATESLVSDQISQQHISASSIVWLESPRVLVSKLHRSPVGVYLPPHRQTSLVGTGQSITLDTDSFITPAPTHFSVEVFGGVLPEGAPTSPATSKLGVYPLLEIGDSDFETSEEMTEAVQAKMSRFTGTASGPTLSDFRVAFEAVMIPGGSVSSQPF